MGAGGPSNFDSETGQRAAQGIRSRLSVTQKENESETKRKTNGRKNKGRSPSQAFRQWRKLSACRVDTRVDVCLQTTASPTRVAVEVRLARHSEQKTNNFSETRSNLLKSTRTGPRSTSLRRTPHLKILVSTHDLLQRGLPPKPVSQGLCYALLCQS